MASRETIPWSHESSPLLVVFCEQKNNNKNGQLDKLSQSFSDVFHNSFTWQKMAKSIVNIAPDINEYLRNVITVQAIQYIAKF